MLNETNDGHKAILRLDGAGKDHGGLLIPAKVTMEMYPVLIDQLNEQIIGTLLQGMNDFPEFICFVTVGSLTTDGPLQPTGDVNTTPRKP